MPKKIPIYGLMAAFDHPDDLLRAVRRARTDGYKEYDAYSPFPVEGLAEAIGLRTGLPWLVFFGGVAGCFVGYFMQYWMNAVDYPINVGGRPLNSWPSFIPVTFEMTVLIAGLTAVVGMLALNGLPRPYHPVFNVEQFERASSNQFFLVIEFDDLRFDEVKTRKFLESLDPVSIHIVEC